MPSAEKQDLLTVKLETRSNLREDSIIFNRAAMQ